MNSGSEWDPLEFLLDDPWSAAVDIIQFDGKKNITPSEQSVKKPQRFNCQRYLPIDRKGCFQFFKLPRELRDKVYEYLIKPCFTHSICLSQWRHHDKSFNPSILHANHQLRDEFLEIFFENITAQVLVSNDSNYYYSAPADIPAAFKPFVKKVSIKYFHTATIGHDIQIWLDFLADAAPRLACFPKLLDAAIVFEMHLYGEIGWDFKAESRLFQSWTDCELRKVNALKEVEFSLRVQRGRDVGNCTYKYVRTVRCGEEDSGLEERLERKHETLKWRDNPFAR